MHFLLTIIALLFQWIESEMSRLSNLRDRASEKGRRKEYPLLFICIDKENNQNMIERRDLKRVWSSDSSMFSMNHDDQNAILMGGCEKK